MAEVFGDPDDFAIEAGAEPDPKPASAVWGHMRVWCRGIPLGDIDQKHCSLYVAYLSFRKLLSPLQEELRIDRLWAEELADLDDVAAWNHLDRLLYGYHGDVEVGDDRTLAELGWDAVVWGRFNFLTNWGEMFDGFKTFVMRPPGGRVRILSRRLPEDIGRSVEVSLDGFVAASQAFVQWFEEQELRQRGQRCRTNAFHLTWPALRFFETSCSLQPARQVNAAVRPQRASRDG